jgi:hypothetical protein
LGYTLAKTYRVFDDSTRQYGTLNGGKPFPFTYDRRHNLSFVATYELNKIQIGDFMLYKRPVTLSGVFVYGTGNAFTPPTAYGGTLSLVQFYTIYGGRNSARMEDYHRADFSATFHGRKDSRLNPYFYYFPQDLDRNTQVLTTKAYKVVVFPIIPSITWDFEF